LDVFLKVLVGVLKDLTQFHRVLVYQFDEAWNGQVVAELIDWNQTRDLYMGLHFPSTDIPAQVSDISFWHVGLSTFIVGEGPLCHQ
jgi:light-regulated signal transduction histidine kinase (bacteriophytochrome)